MSIPETIPFKIYTHALTLLDETATDLQAAEAELETLRHENENLRSTLIDVAIDLCETGTRAASWWTAAKYFSRQERSYRLEEPEPVMTLTQWCTIRDALNTQATRRAA